MHPTSSCVAESQTASELTVVPPFPIQDLPYEIFCRVLGWLDRGPIPLVCSYWKSTIEDITLWETQQEVTTRLNKLIKELIHLNTHLDDSCAPEARKSLQKQLLKIDAFLNSEDVEVTPQMLELNRETIDQIAEEWSCLPLEKVTHLKEHTASVQGAIVPWLPTLFDLTDIFARFHQAGHIPMKEHAIIDLTTKGFLDTAFNAISKLEFEVSKVEAMRPICEKAQGNCMKIFLYSCGNT